MQSSSESQIESKLISINLKLFNTTMGCAIGYICKRCPDLKMKKSGMLYFTYFVSYSITLIYLIG